MNWLELRIQFAANELKAARKACASMSIMLFICGSVLFFESNLIYLNVGNRSTYLGIGAMTVTIIYCFLYLLASMKEYINAKDFLNHLEKYKVEEEFSYDKNLIDALSAKYRRPTPNDTCPENTPPESTSQSAET